MSSHKKGETKRSYYGVIQVLRIPRRTGLDFEDDAIGREGMIMACVLVNCNGPIMYGVESEAHTLLALFRKMKLG